MTLTDVEKPLQKMLTQLVSEQNTTLFYTGGMGEFDELFGRTVRTLKRTDPSVRLILVLPYLTRRLATEKALFETQYDEILIPAELDGVHPKAAINLRNRWIVDHSDIVITALQRDIGGAAEAVRYAETRNKEVLYL